MKETIMSRSRLGVILLIVFAVGVSFISLTSFGQESKKGEKGEYVGPETCKGCHPDIHSAFGKDNPHWKNIEDPKASPEKKGCESCHGPGGKHAEAEGKGFIFSFKDKDARTLSDACLSCHQKGRNLFQAERGIHRLSAVACNDCHQVHGTRVAKNFLKKRDPDLCISCHADVKSKFYLSRSHAIFQGRGGMKCSDCHTPHGTRTYGNLRKINKFSKEDACFKCHPEKRGPWVFEHGATKYEGCSACHVPHGSPNRFLLTQSQIRLVCIQCHGQIHFPKFQCNNCHTQIHGSNFSSRFLQ